MHRIISMQGIWALQHVARFVWLACCVLQVRGKMSCLLINDIDAGLGHFANTQVSVSSRTCRTNSMHFARTEVCGAPCGCLAGATLRQI